MFRCIVICSAFIFCHLIALAQSEWQEFNYGFMRSAQMKAYMMYQIASTKKDKEQRFKELINFSRSKGNEFLLIKGYTQHASWYRAQGDYTSAKSLLDSAIEYASREDIEKGALKYSRDGTSVFDVYEETGHLYLELGNLQEAKRWYEKSIRIKEERLNKGDLAQVTPYLGLAEINSVEGKYEQAVAGYEDVLKRLIKVTSTLKTPYATYTKTYMALARNNFAIKAYKEALKYATTGLKIVNDPTNALFLVGQKIRLRSELLNLKAKSYLGLGEFDKAIKFFEKAQESFFEVYTREDNNYTELLKTEIEIAKIQMNENNIFDLFEELMDNHLSFIDNNFAFLSEKEKEDFYDKVKDDVKYYYEYQFASFLKTQDRKVLIRILNRQLTTKAFILSDINRIKRGILESGNDQLIESFETYQDLKGRVATILYNDPSDIRVDSLKLILNEKEKYLSQASEVLKSESRKVDWLEVKNSLTSSEVAIECIRIPFNDKIYYLMLIIRPEELLPDFVVFDNGEELDEKAIKAYRSSIIYKIEDKDSYNLFWQPVAEKIKTNSTIYFSPDGVFHQLSLATLYDPATDRYLVDNFKILNVTNTRDLINQRKEQSISEVVLFGRPDYDFEDHTFSDATLNASAILMRSNMSMTIDKFFDQNFSDLPGTSEEVFAITNTLQNKNWETTSYLGSDATEEQIKLIENPGILHVATHGFFLGGNEHINPMMKSGLVLAGVKNQSVSKKDDGVLTAYEATALKLENTNLVVLSACETALGDVKDGEGVYGLQRALIVAGAKKLIMSMWKVNDEATRDLMIAFYSKLSDNKKIEDAFREAQLEVKKKYDHPNFWGAFVLITS